MTTILRRLTPAAAGLSWRCCWRRRSAPPFRSCRPSAATPRRTFPTRSPSSASGWRRIGWRGDWTAPNRASSSSCRATSLKSWSGRRPWRSRRGRIRRGWSRPITTRNWRTAPSSAPVSGRWSIRRPRRACCPSVRSTWRCASRASRTATPSSPISTDMTPRCWSKRPATIRRRSAGRPAPRPGPEGLQFDLQLPRQPGGRAGTGPARRPGRLRGRRRPFRAASLRDAEPQRAGRWPAAAGRKSPCASAPPTSPRCSGSVSRPRRPSPPPDSTPTFTFTLQALHQGARELVFECDPELRPYEVTGARPGKMGSRRAGPGRSRVPARPSVSPTRWTKGPFQIRCLAPLGAAAGGPGPVVWTSPGIRLRRCVPGGETLVLKVHPDLRLAALRPGGFRLKETGTEAQADGQAALRRSDLRRRRRQPNRRAPTETAGPPAAGDALPARRRVSRPPAGLVARRSHARRR